ncbi:MAG: hypothetical protein HW421_676 [Ignavibacteria bacterium]|nr:hypothetical protein [Ignavibacteria bacterium]
MKHFIIILLFFLGCLPVFAEEHPMPAKNIAFNGSAIFKPTLFKNEFSTMFGARFNAIYRKNFSFGLGLYNLTGSDLSTEYIDEATNKKPHLEFNYYSLEFEYIFNPQDILYYSISGIIGYGNLKFALTTRKPDGSFYEPDFGSKNNLVIEPILSAGLNINSWFRISFGGGYRIMPGIVYKLGPTTFDESIFNGIVALFSMQLGSF